MLAAIAEWLAMLPPPVGKETQVCALAAGDDHAVLVEQRPHPRVLPVLTPGRRTGEEA